MAMLAMIVRRNDVMPPMTAATRASDNVWGPRVVTSPAEPVCPAIRTIDSVDSAAASAHTKVETTLGLMLDRRASCGLLAQALTVLPSVVRSRNQVSAMSVTGTMIRIERSEPRICHPGHRPRRLEGARVVHGETGRLRDLEGDRLGDLRHADGGDEHDDPGGLAQPANDRQRRRSAPKAQARPPARPPEPPRTARGTARPAATAMAAPMTPMLPTAKLMIRVARYTRTTPTAITAMASPARSRRRRSGC